MDKDGRFLGMREPVNFSSYQECLLPEGFPARGVSFFRFHERSGEKLSSRNCMYKSVFGAADPGDPAFF